MNQRSMTAALDLKLVDAETDQLESFIRTRSRALDNEIDAMRNKLHHRPVAAAPPSRLDLYGMKSPLSALIPSISPRQSILNQLDHRQVSQICGLL